VPLIPRQMLPPQIARPADGFLSSAYDCIQDGMGRKVRGGGCGACSLLWHVSQEPCRAVLKGTVC
jgi:hypothetical protein